MKKMEEDLIQQSDIISTLRKEKKALSETITTRNQTILSLQQEFKRMKTVQQPPGSGKISVSSGGASGTLDVQQHSKEQSKIILKQKKQIESLEVSSRIMADLVFITSL